MLKKIEYKLSSYKKSFLNRLYSIYAEKFLRNKDVSIICSNCYGGHLYETLNLPYTTPTVGLYFFPEDFLKFAQNLDYYLEQDLKFISKSRHSLCQKEHELKKYPIGLLPDHIEIHFLHYNTEEEARSKWDRRKLRLNRDHIVVIMNDQNGFTPDMIGGFDQVPYPKVFLASKPLKSNHVRVLSRYKSKPHVGDIYNEKLEIFGDFNLIKWLNAVDRQERPETNKKSSDSVN